MAATDAGETFILALDLGTSGPKVGLVATQGHILAHEFEPTRLLLLPNGGAEQDPNDWWRAICQATHRLLDRRLVPVEQIVAVNCTGQWAGTVAVDRSGQPLMNAIIWLDTRGAPYSQQLVGGRIAVQGYDLWKVAQWIRLAGMPPARSGKDPAGHILFIRHETPDVYRDTYKFLEPLDYLNLRLTGLFASACETIGAHLSTDNRRIDNIHYAESLLRLNQMPRDKLPDLHPTASVLGTLTGAAAAELGLSRATRVVAGTPDLHSAAIGSGAVANYAPHIYLGTSAWVLCHVPFKRTDPLHGVGAVAAGIPGRYLAGTVQETGGACLNFLRDTLFEGGDGNNSYDRLNQLAEEAPAGSSGVIFTPWLYGERAPVDDSTVRGGFHNLSLGTKRADMVRAVFEGVALNARWGFRYTERFMRRRLDPIRAIGGGASSPVWCQIFADVFGRTIQQVAEPSLCNVRGAALQAAASLGYMTFDGIAERTPVTRSFSPNPKHRDLYEELFTEFVHLYRQNRGIYARLNRRRDGRS